MPSRWERWKGARSALGAAVGTVKYWGTVFAAASYGWAWWEGLVPSARLATALIVAAGCALFAASAKYLMADAPNGTDSSGNRITAGSITAQKLADVYDASEAERARLAEQVRLLEGERSLLQDKIAELERRSESDTGALAKWEALAIDTMNQSNALGKKLTEAVNALNNMAGALHERPKAGGLLRPAAAEIDKAALVQGALRVYNEWSALQTHVDPLHGAHALASSMRELPLSGIQQLSSTGASGAKPDER